MKEQILKMIRKPIFPKTINGEKLNCDAQEAAAKEIESYVMEFIEWLQLNCDTGNGYWDIGDLTEYYDQDIYNYWLYNIKK